MDRHITTILVTLFTLIFATAALGAPQGLNHDEAEKLIKGNTAEGTNAFKKKMIWYFDENGKIFKGNKKGRKIGKAEWSINSRGELCYKDKNMNFEKCGPILPLGDGKYNVRLENPWMWDKVVPGNPHNF